jgi:hypothetical protein
MTARKLIGVVFIAGIGAIATTASGDTPAKFGPLDSRVFHWKGGTSIERPTDNCASNIDWLLVRAPGIANAKQIDVSPKVSMFQSNSSFPASNCTGTDCVPIYVKITSKDAAGTRTVTAKSGDGRTITTTFDVIENAGRCDYPKK